MIRHPKRTENLKQCQAASFQKKTTIIKKKLGLDDVEFHETKLRVPNGKPPFQIVPETSELGESKKVELTLKDNVTAFLTGKLDPEMRAPSHD